MRVNLHEARRNLLKLVAAVERGETEEVEIVRAGQVLARIVAPRPMVRRAPGRWAGRVTIHSDFDDLPDDVTAALSRRGDVRVLLDTPSRSRDST